MKKSGKSFVMGLLFLMFGFGLTVTMVAPLISRVIADFSLTTAQGALISTFLSIGGLLAVGFTLLCADRLPKLPLHRGAYLLFSLALLCVALSRGYYALLLLILAVGFGSKVVDILANPILADRFPAASGRYLNTMHMTLGIGACVGPMLLQLALDRGLSWRLAFAGIGGLCLLLMLLSIVLMRGAPETAAAASRAAEGRLDWGVIVPLCLTTFFYQGHQIIVNTWGPMYCERALGLAGTFASLSTTALWAGIIISRFLGARYVRPERTVSIAAWGNLIGGAALIGGVLSGMPVVVMAGLMIAGVCSGAVIPMVVAYLCGLYPKATGRVTSVVFLTLVAAPMVFPWMAGKIADIWGFMPAMLVSGAALLAAAACAAVTGLPRRT